MKVQNHIKTCDGTAWYRCKHVEFAGENAIWELSQSSRYTFFEAYRQTPHRQLIEADNDPALRAFVKSWGPLRFSLDAWSGRDLIETYRRERDVLTARVRLLASVKEPEMQRPVLLELSEISRQDISVQIFLNQLRQQFQIPGSLAPGFDENIRLWLEAVEQKQIQAATVYLVPRFLLSLEPPSFTVERSARQDVLRATLGITSLMGALNWMVWQDVFQEHPFQFCAECRNLFQPDTRHEKKFCSPECAHRKTAREWQKRKRDTERKSNGTKKAR